MNKKTHLIPLQSWRIEEGKTDNKIQEKNPILSLNENLKREDGKKTHKKNHHVPMQKWKKSKRGTVGEKNPILSLYENENLKRGTEKNKKTNKKKQHHVPMRK